MNEFQPQYCCNMPLELIKCFLKKAVEFWKLEHSKEYFSYFIDFIFLQFYPWSREFGEFKEKTCSKFGPLEAGAKPKKFLGEAGNNDQSIVSVK